MLDVMNRPLIIHNLRERFCNNEIYVRAVPCRAALRCARRMPALGGARRGRAQTNVGTILISVNPYKLLPLYTPQMIDKYRHRGASGRAGSSACGCAC
jgi:hypothetical protein